MVVVVKEKSWPCGGKGWGVGCKPSFSERGAYVFGFRPLHSSSHQGLGLRMAAERRAQSVMALRILSLHFFPPSSPFLREGQRVFWLPPGASRCISKLD